MSARIAVVGSLNIDLVTRTHHIPIPGETVLGGDLHTFPGGKGANQAVAAARLGADVSMIGHVGDDLFAEQLRRALDGDGVDHRFVTAVEGASGVALIVIDEAGQNSIVVASGANAALTPADVESVAPAIESADVLLLQLETPLDAVQRATELAHAAGVTVLLNPAPARQLPHELLRLVDILIPNESETAILTGLSPATAAGWAGAARRLRELGAGTVILTLGGNGALLVQEGEEIHVPAFAVETVVDTTAAGDAFVSGMAVAVGEGLTLPEAVRMGNAAGALAVTRDGAQPSLPHRADVVARMAGS